MSCSINVCESLNSLSFKNVSGSTGIQTNNTEQMKQKYYSDFVLNKVWTNNHLRIIRITKKRCTIAYSEKYFTGNYNRLIFSPILEIIFLLEKILWTAEQYNIRMQFKIEMKKKTFRSNRFQLLFPKILIKKNNPLVCVHI